MGIVAAFAGVLAGIIGNVLSTHIVYFFTKRGRKPNPRPKLIWLMFYLSAFIFIVFSSVAAFAPSPDTSNVVLAPNTPEPLRPTSLELKPSVIDIVNNDLATQYNSNPSVVFALDPLNMRGQSPPYVFFEVEHGTQLWYGMMNLPDHIQTIETRTMPTGVDQVVVQTDTGHFFYIDPIDGDVINVTAGGTGVQQNPPEYTLIE